jgi:cAMP phosphodiesterase
MKIRLVPSHVVEPTAIQVVTTVLVNDEIAIDAGCIASGLGRAEQERIRHVIVTHSHLDHTAGLPPFLTDRIGGATASFPVHASRATIDSLRQHTFNDVVWPNFEKIPLPNGAGPILKLVEIEAGRPFELLGLRFTPVAMNHVVPTLGLVIEDDHSAVAVTSDTYRTDGIWEVAGRAKNLRAVFVDVSYPDELESLAAVAKHLTPQSLRADLAKLRGDAKVYAVHLKPDMRDRIAQQLAAIDRPKVHSAEIGKTYSF